PGARQQPPADPLALNRPVAPQSLQLAAAAPNDAADAPEKPPLVVTSKDRELPDAAGRSDRRGLDLLLEHRQVGRIGRLLDEEAVRGGHRVDFCLSTRRAAAPAGRRRRSSSGTPRSCPR